MIQVGAVGVFQETPIPVGAILPAGIVPSWTSSDATIATVESPNSDATGATIKVTGMKAGTFTLTVSATLPGGNVIQGSATVQVVAAPPPAPTGFTISQLS